MFGSPLPFIGHPSIEYDKQSQLAYISTQIFQFTSPQPFNHLRCPNSRPTIKHAILLRLGKLSERMVVQINYKALRGEVINNKQVSFIFGIRPLQLARNVLHSQTHSKIYFGCVTAGWSAHLIVPKITDMNQIFILHHSPWHVCLHITFTWFSLCHHPFNPCNLSRFLPRLLLEFTQSAVLLRNSLVFDFFLWTFYKIIKINKWTTNRIHSSTCTLHNGVGMSETKFKLGGLKSIQQLFLLANNTNREIECLYLLKWASWHQ